MIRERVIECQTAEEVVDFADKKTDSSEYPPCLLDQKEVEHILFMMGVLWQYKGEPAKEKPHALITSGKHSDGYIDLGMLCKNFPEVRLMFAYNLAWAARVRIKINWKYAWVVGADTSSTALARDVANILGAKHIKMVKITHNSGEKKQWCEIAPPEDYSQLGLQIEDVINTGLSARQVREGIRNVFPNAGFLPIMPVIVNRSDPNSPVKAIGDSIIISLLRLEMRNYGLEECPYCRVGSEAIVPKEGDNWKRLTEV